MIYAVNMHDTHSIRIQYANDMQIYAIAIRKSIRIHTHVYAIHILPLRYAIHNMQLPKLSIRMIRGKYLFQVHTHQYASILVRSEQFADDRRRDAAAAVTVTRLERCKSLQRARFDSEVALPGPDSDQAARVTPSR